MVMGAYDPCEKPKVKENKIIELTYKTCFESPRWYVGRPVVIAGDYYCSKLVKHLGIDHKIFNDGDKLFVTVSSIKYVPNTQSTELL